MILLLGSVVAIRLPVVQTYVTQLIASELSEMLGTKVSIDGVYIEFFSTLDVRGVYVEDLKEDTLLYANHLKGKFSLLDLKERHIGLGELVLEDANFYLKRYEGEEHLNLQFIIDAFKSEDTTSASYVLTCRSVNLKEVHFKYENFNAEEKDYGVDFNHLDVRSLNLNASYFKLEEDTIKANFKSLALEEKSGFSLHSFKGKATVDPNHINVEELAIVTSGSNIDTDLEFNYNGYAGFEDFLNEVNMNYNIRKADVDVVDISYFAPALRGIENKVALSGEVRGTVSQLKGRKLIVGFGPNSFLSGRMDLMGLPDINETFMVVNLKELVTNKQDLEEIPLPPFQEGKRIELPQEIARMGDLRFKGSFTGFINDFVAFGQLQSALGNVTSDLNLKRDTLSGQIVYSGKVSTDKFQLGKMVANENMLGIVSMNVKVSGNGVSKEDAKATLSGSLKEFDFNGYRYTHINVKGDLTDRKFNGRLDIDDKNIKLNFIGDVDLANNPPVFDFSAEIKNAHLAKLKLVDRDSSAVLSLKVNSNFKGISVEKARGKVVIEDLAFTEKDKTFKLDSLAVTAADKGKNKIFSFQSDYLDGNITGDFDTELLPESFSYMIYRIVPLYFEDEIKAPNRREVFDFAFHVKRANTWLKVIRPDIQINETVTLEGHYNNQDSKFDLKVDAPHFATNKINFERNKIVLNKQGDTLDVKGKFAHIDFTDSLGLDEVLVESKLLSNTLQFGFAWENDSEKLYTGDINGLVFIEGRDQFRIRLLNSDIYVADSLWTVSDGNTITIDSTSISIRDLRFQSGKHFFDVAGIISGRESDEMTVTVQDFDLSYLNIFTQESGVRLAGKIDGNAKVSNPYKELVFSSDMELTALEINDQLLGDGGLKADWDVKNQFARLKGNLRRDQVDVLTLHGFYYPKREKDQLEVSANVRDFNLVLLEPFIADQVSELSGTAGGRIRVRGRLDHPELKGKLNLKNTGFRFNYLNTYYTIPKGNIIVEPDWIGFDVLTIVDEEGDEVTATATVFHENFARFNYDLTLDANSFLFLNTTAVDNDLFYGTADLTGQINVSGYKENTLIEITAKTNKGTSFAIPLSGSTEISENDFINFVKRDTNKEIESEKISLSGIQMQFKLDVTEDAKVQIIFDEKVGDILKARGNGSLDLQINTLGNFNIYGDYVITEGDYLFTLQNIINKRFKLEKGGSIVWNGSPYDAQLDINAIYSLRASPHDLVASIDTSNAYNRRVPVDCLLKMRGNIMNPQLSFDIDLPTLPESDIANQLLDKNSMSEQQMNEQIFSLLLINRFVSPDRGIQTAGIGSTSTSEVLSNQLSNWLSQISNDFDIGFNYRPGDEVSNEQVEVALSTQLFNDRVLVEGNVGVGGDNVQTNQNNTVAGDFNIEYKINEDGTVKAKVFNKSNDYNNVNVNNSPYTQGVGVFYREEFDTVDQLIDKWFGWLWNNKKKKK